MADLVIPFENFASNNTVNINNIVIRFPTTFTFDHSA